MSQRRILVTGGNAGIGFALCRQLVHERSCHVYLGSRSVEKGNDAANQILSNKPSESSGFCQLVQIDTSSDTSVADAACTVKSLLKADGAQLYAVVNNAGTGLNHGSTADQIVNTNLYGPKRVCDAFLALLDCKEGRIVNVGSGAGPMYVQKCPVEIKRLLCSPEITWPEIEEHAKAGLGSPADSMSGYGLSKALLHSYTMLLAKEQPHLKINALSPGFIETSMTKGWGATKQPEEGTVSIMHCLFGELEGNGLYYGSDAVRSPLYVMRNPGEPAYTGELPF